MTLQFVNRMHWSNFFANSAILFGAMLIAVQLRLEFPFGSPLQTNYIAQPVLTYPILLASAFISTWIVRHNPMSRINRTQSSARQQFFQLLLAIMISLLCFIVLLPNLSPIQLAYYALTAILFGLVLIGFPSHITGGKRPNVLHHLKILVTQRELLWLWTTNNIRARYSQAVLGIAWIVLLPLSQSLILAFIFSQVIRMDVGNVPYVTFFMSALVPWAFFSQGIINSTMSIMSMIGLINQIYFPREVLVLVRLGELIVDVLCILTALFLINLTQGVLPNLYYIYLLPLFFISLTLTLGFMLFFSYLTVLIRDIPQLVTVALQLLFYLTPIIYPLNFMPPQFRVIALINPMVPVVQAYRDIITYGIAPNFVSLYYPFVMGIAMLYLSYNFFKVNERRLADFV